ncbi:hypothetical protein M422DRAFT_203530 [Sphaerobolus stellatus SS14]|nr:hypothetical protein M422DRAFT_203530 [Sphaerobolus stellatus SS14]
MSSPPVIRRLKQNDIKLAKFLISLSLMQPLTTANNNAYFHPLTLSVWVGISSIMMVLFKWWPSTTGPLGYWGLLWPVPAFATMAVPILIFFEWFHRPVFEEPLQKALREEDIRDLIGYYSRSPASGFYVLEHKEKVIGIVGLDANAKLDADAKPSKSKSTATSATASTALIRHFFLEEQYRGAGVQADLLEYAVAQAFMAKISPQRIRILVHDLEPYKREALKSTHFHPVKDWDPKDGPKEWTSGIYGWNYRWHEVTKDEWKPTIMAEDKN